MTKSGLEIVGKALLEVGGPFSVKRCTIEPCGAFLGRNGPKLAKKWTQNTWESIVKRGWARIGMEKSENA